MKATFLVAFVVVACGGDVVGTREAVDLRADAASEAASDVADVVAPHPCELVNCREDRGHVTLPDGGELVCPCLRVCPDSGSCRAP